MRAYVRLPPVFLSTSFVLCMGMLIGSLEAQVSMDFVTIGNPGNGNNVGTPPLGGVSDRYRISKYEVTNEQYAAFLNAVDPTGSNSLDLFDMGMATKRGGISNTGTVNGSRYEITAGRGNKPVTYIDWTDAARFANWMHNGQVNGDTESGAYTMADGTTETRNAGANYFLPSESEWYKAAYHKNDGVTVNYWAYPFGSDDIPYSDNPMSLNTPDDTNVGNFFKNDSIDNGYDGGFATSGVTQDGNTPEYFTDVGEYTLSASPYGVFDMGGGVREWMEDLAGGSGDARVFRGGCYIALHSEMRIFSRIISSPELFDSSLQGFRIGAPVPTETGTGDANADGSFDFGDIETFFLAITDLPAYTAQYPNVVLSTLDMNFDGNMDFGDIEAFFVAVTGG